jgi:2-methylisocitrate lyase-like PEP mutase family enzyme
MAGAKLIPREQHARRLRGAMAARGGTGLVVIGRTDALGVEGLEAALERARAYADAGVDLVLVDGVKTRAQVEAIARGLEAPGVLSLVDGTDAARITAAEAADMGFAVLLHAVTTLFAATQAMAAALQALAEGGAPDPSGMIDYAEFTGIVGLGRYQDFERDFG